MQIDSLGLPKYGTQDLMDLVYKGKLDTLFKVYAEKNEETTQFNSAVKESGQGPAIKFYEQLDIGREEFDKLLQTMNTREQDYGGPKPPSPSPKTVFIGLTLASCC